MLQKKTFLFYLIISFFSLREKKLIIRYSEMNVRSGQRVAIAFESTTTIGK